MNATVSTRPRPATLDWFTHAILANGQQICAIRPASAPGPNVVLDEAASRLLQAMLTEIAQDTTIPFGDARQAVLRAFVRAA